MEKSIEVWIIEEKDVGIATKGERDSYDPLAVKTVSAKKYVCVTAVEPGTCKRVATLTMHIPEKTAVFTEGEFDYIIQLGQTYEMHKAEIDSEAETHIASAKIDIEKKRLFGGNCESSS